MTSQTGFILLSSLASKSASCDLAGMVDKGDKIVIDNVQKTAELYSFLSQNSYNSSDILEAQHDQVEMSGSIAQSLTSGSHSEMVCKPSEDEKFSESKSYQVTHIEIIKPQPGSFRRMSGANRVVPLITNVWQNGLLDPVDNGISSTYRTFLADLQNFDDRQCEICDQLLLSSTDLKYHARDIHGTIDIVDEQCFVCRKKYVFKSQLKSHLSIFHGIQYPELICKICFMEFNTTIEHKAHERKHDSSYLCQICSAKFRSEYFLQEHVETHLASMKPNECRKCGQRFGNRFSLMVHMKRHENITCFLCDAILQDELLLLFHVRNHKRCEKQKFLKRMELMDQEESQLEDVLNAYIKISSCDKRKVKQERTNMLEAVQGCMEDVLSAVSLTQKHHTLQDSISSTRIRCKLCDIEVETAQDLIDHRRKVHLRSRSCPFCGKRYRTVSQTWRHMATHVSKRNKGGFKNDVVSEAVNHEPSKEKKRVVENSPPYDCTICSRKFQYPASRNKHVLLHNKNGANGWKCTVCDEVFLQPKLLLKHMAVHESEVKCHLCDGVFSKGTLLKAHMKSHNREEGQKRFKCSLCPVYCSTPSGLRVHHLVHTGERPYSCSICSRKFRRLQAVKKHMLVVHRGSSLQLYNCPDCPVKSNSIGNLVRHFLRIHRQVRRYVCGVCGSRYGQNQDLRRHFKINHDMEMPVIRGTDRKALNEIYVIPNIDNLPDSHPHVQKINRIVAEEKQKFQGIEEMLKKQKSENVAETSSFSCHESQKGCSSEIPNASDAAENSIGSSSLHLHSCSLNNLCEDGERAALNRNSIQKSCSLHLPGDHRTSCCISFDDNSDMTLKSCNLCHAVILGESEFQTHISESQKYFCKECNKNFCDQISLENHLTIHAVPQFRCQVCMLDFRDKVAYEKHITEMKSVFPESIGKAHDAHSQRSLHGIANDISSHEQESHPGKDNTTRAEPGTEDIAAGNGMVPNVVCVDAGFCTSVPKQMISSNSNMTNDIISTTSGINGIMCTSTGYLVCDVIVQPMPNVIQSMPIAYTSQNALPMPVYTLQSATLPTLIPSDQNSSSVITADNLRNVSFLNPLENVQISVEPSINICENPESRNQETLVSQVPVNAIISGEPPEVLISSNVGSSQEEKLKQSHEPAHNPEEGSLQSTNDSHQSPGKYFCTSCGDQFSNSNSLSRHTKIHSEVKPYGCLHCGKKFAEKCNLKVHLRIHTGERPYSCELCGMQLRYQKDVSDHRRMHLGVKSYICDECGREFVRRRGLARHKLTHSGEKRHKCPICSKAFARLDQLKLAHLPTHDVSQQLSCEKCSKTFRLKSKLKQHMALHSGQKDFNCPTCYKSFARESYLKSHLNTHRKQDGYVQCPKCPRRFASKETLSVHETTFHERPLKSVRKTSYQNSGRSTAPKCNEDDDKVLDTESPLELVDIEIQDMGLDILEGDQCNAVIYLHMARSEDDSSNLFDQ